MRSIDGFLSAHGIVRSRGRLTGIALTLLLSGTAAPLLAESGQELRMHQDVRRRTLTLEVGPVRLPGNAGYEVVHTPVVAGGVFAVDGWLRSFEVRVVDARGRALHGVRIHHAALLAPGERNVFSPTLRRIVAFGSETSGIKLPGQLGYRVQPGDSVVLAGAFYNPTPEAFDSVYLHVRIVYADARLDARHQDVLPIYMDAMPTGSVTFGLPSGETRRSWEWRPAVGGRVLGLGGHMHAYGTALLLEDATTGETLWTGRVEHDEAGGVVGVTRTFFLRGLEVRPDHVYRVTAVYSNPTDVVIEGAMGQIGGLLLPSTGQRMPQADPSHPDYQLDLVSQTGYGQHAHHQPH